jgi:hypothetical protein
MAPADKCTPNPPAKAVEFAVAVQAVLRGFEQVHRGMDGLRFVSAEFPDGAGYCVRHKMVGFGRVKCVRDWTDDVCNPLAIKAYWATRSANNCASLNHAPCRVIRGMAKIAGTDTLRVPNADGEDILLVSISSLEVRTIGLTPYHVGTIFDPPCISKVPPSSDGETFHAFCTGLQEGDRHVVALDCSLAQYGLFFGGDQRPS